MELTTTELQIRLKQLREANDARTKLEQHLIQAELDRRKLHVGNELRLPFLDSDEHAYITRVSTDTVSYEITREIPVGSGVHIIEGLGR